MHIRTLCILTIAALLSACATTPVPVGEAKPVDDTRLLAFKVAPSTPHGTMVVFRDVGFLGGGCYYALSVNGTLAVRLGPGEVAKLYVPTGELLLRAGRDPMGAGLCALDQDNWTQRETIFRPNEVKDFRLSIDSNGKLDVQRADVGGK
ncbi:hypothetical protein [Sulfuriferula sp.]|uniref:hypothetical protein n=1 Tax=Sulfuriferula sp. TaxID=2025307 RepID=UPI00273201C9|nr:hypothetical protein [Sulfuriferula sp.]MDP2026249.1 hypothetical protein [Sulfuriferula sp.]